jgi:hypothetical protein
MAFLEVFGLVAAEGHWSRVHSCEVDEWSDETFMLESTIINAGIMGFRVAAPCSLIVRLIT